MWSCSNKPDIVMRYDNKILLNKICWYISKAFGFISVLSTHQI